MKLKCNKELQGHTLSEKINDKFKHKSFEIIQSEKTKE